MYYSTINCIYYTYYSFKHEKKKININKKGSKMSKNALRIKNVK